MINNSKTHFGIILTAALAVAPLAVHADTIVIGGGVQSFSESFPFYSVPEYQQVYSGSAFSGPVEVDSITFYDTKQKALQYSLGTGPVTMYLSTTAAAVNGLSTTFSNNVGPDQTLVYSALPPTDTALSAGGVDFNFQLSTPFTYNPAMGNLLLTILPSTEDAYSSLDASVTPQSSRALLQGFNNVLVADDVGLVTGFDVSPSPVPLPATFWLLLSGAGGLGFLSRARKSRPA